MRPVYAQIFMSLLKNTVYASLAGLVVSGGRFALTVVLARKLNVGDFGYFAYVQWLLDTLYLCLSFGFGALASRYLAQFASQPALLHGFERRLSLAYLIIPLLVMAAFYVAHLWFATTRDGVELVLATGWAGANSLVVMQTAALTGYQRWRGILVQNLAGVATLLVGAFSLPAAGAGCAQAFAVMLTGSVGAAAAGAYLVRAAGGTAVASKVRDTPNAVAQVDWRQVRSYALNTWAAALLASFVWSRGEVPVLKWLQGDVVVGRYAAALAIWGGAVQFVMLASSAIAPHIAQCWGRGDVSGAMRVAARVLNIQLLLASAGSLLVILFGPQLLQLVFSSDYGSSAPVLRWLFVGLFALSVSGYSYLLQISTNGAFNRNALVLAAIVLYLSAFVFISAFGAVGAGMSRAASLFAIFLLTIWFAGKVWQFAGIPMKNIAYALGLVLSVMVLADTVLADSGTATKTAVFCAAIGLLAMVKEPDGRPTLVTLWNKLLRRDSTSIRNT